jgi:hypothetical protein
VISQAERDRPLAFGPDLAVVWNAQTTTPRDRKELLRTLIEDVTIKVDRDKAAAHLALRWKGGALNEIDLARARDTAGYRPHRREHDRAAAPARGPLPRWCDLRRSGPRHIVIASPLTASATCAATGVFPASS